MDDPKPSEIVKFGVFELDPRSGELRRSGYQIKIQEQPFKVLMTLLEHPGEVVTQQELQTLIWPDESFGDFDHALRVPVGKLRRTLNDSAEAPRFIETLSRRSEVRLIARSKLQKAWASTSKALVPNCWSARVA